MTKFKIHRRKVNSTRNSDCCVPLDALDWSNWWTDGYVVGGEHRLYLHVPDKRPEFKGCSYRVRCKHNDEGTMRIAMKDGELFWLWSEECEE